MSQIKTFLCLIVTACFPLLSFASAPTSRADSLSAGSIGVEFHHSYMLPTNKFFRGENFTGKPMRYAASQHVRYTHRFSSTSYIGSIYPKVYQGIGASINSFQNTKEIGRPIAFYIFQGSPIVNLSESLTLGYEWDFGITFGWKHFDSETNYYNVVVGSDLNAYMNVALTLDWNFARHWDLLASVELTHFSNGNTAYPNAGVNLAGSKIGLTRSFGPITRKTRQTKRDVTKPFRHRFGLDLVLYGSTRVKGIILPEEAFLAPGSFAIAGVNLAPMCTINKFFRAGLSIDAQYDESANIKEYIASRANRKFYRPPFKEQFCVGASGRIEFTMPIFAVNVGMGRTLIYEGADTDYWYQSLTLKASITKFAFINIGYQLSDFHTPNNLMLGIGVKFW